PTLKRRLRSASGVENPPRRRFSSTVTRKIGPPRAPGPTGKTRSGRHAFRLPVGNPRRSPAPTAPPHPQLTPYGTSPAPTPHATPVREERRAQIHRVRRDPAEADPVLRREQQLPAAGKRVVRQRAHAFAPAERELERQGRPPATGQRPAHEEGLTGQSAGEI